LGEQPHTWNNAKVTGDKIGNFYARDAYYLKDGKIFRQIAMTLPPDRDCGGGWVKQKSTVPEPTRRFLRRYGAERGPMVARAAG